MKRTALVLALCLTLSAAMPVFASPLAVEQVPAAAKWVLHADVEAILASQAGGSLLAEANKAGLDKQMAVIKNIFGVDPTKDLKAITLYGVDFEKDGAVILIRAAFEQDKLLAVLKANETYVESKYGEHVIHQWTDKAKGDNPPETKFGCFYQADLGIIAPSMDRMKQALDVLDHKGDSLAKGSKLLPTPAKGEFLTATATGLAMAAKANRNAAVMALAESACLQAGESEDKLFVRLAVTAKTPQVAADLRKMADGFLAFLDLAQQVEESGKAAVPPELAAIIKDISVSAQDNTVEIKAQAPTANAVALLQWMIHKEKAKKAAQAKTEPSEK